MAVSSRKVGEVKYEKNGDGTFDEHIYKRTIAASKVPASQGGTAAECQTDAVKWETNGDGTFSKYLCEAGRGWVFIGDFPANQVPASQGGTGPG
jgi:hypothetical protein